MNDKERKALMSAYAFAKVFILAVEQELFGADGPLSLSDARLQLAAALRDLEEVVR